MGVGDTIGEEFRNTRDFKTEKDIGSKKTELLLLKKRTISIKDRHLIVKQRDTSQDGIWGRDSWGTMRWTGTYSSTYTVQRVVNPNRKFVDNLYSTTFKDTNSTATWDGSGSITFDTTSQIALSTAIFKNNETISSATLTATATGSGSLTYYLSADGGNNWENVTNETEHTFTNTGKDLRWKASGSDKVITKIEIDY